MATIRKLEPHEVPVPGGSFLVPSLENVPILLPGHEDADLCVSGGEVYHYHIDWRWRFRANVGPAGQPFWLDWREPEYNRALRGHPDDRDVQYRPFVCGRASVEDGSGLSLALVQLITNHQDHTLDSCGRCPHRGTVVDPVSLVCPAHGLTWKADGTLKWRKENCYAVWYGHKTPLTLPVTKLERKASSSNDPRIYIYHDDELIAVHPDLKVSAIVGDVVNLNCLPTMQKTGWVEVLKELKAGQDY